MDLVQKMFQKCSHHIASISHSFLNSITQQHRNSGFTLIELVAVLTILGILASFSIPRFVEIDSNASRQALISSVTELNGRESLVWSKIKLSNSGWIEDEVIFEKMDTGLGLDYKWSPEAKIDGGKLHYRDQMVKLDRKPSTVTSAAMWEINKLSSD